MVGRIKTGKPFIKIRFEDIITHKRYVYAGFSTQKRSFCRHFLVCVCVCAVCVFYSGCPIYIKILWLLDIVVFLWKNDARSLYRKYIYTFVFMSIAFTLFLVGDTVQAQKYRCNEMNNK